MKNIYILPTDKPSRLYLDANKEFQTRVATISNRNVINQNIYITSDEEIKEGDYWIYICPINGLDYGDNNNPIVKNNLPNSWFEKLHDKKNYKKIILTTDQDLIKDGVQAIDDEFLEWFVKNPNCKEVLVINLYGDFNPIKYEYKIIIPKEDPKQDFPMQKLIDIMENDEDLKPKQETIEESYNRIFDGKLDRVLKAGFIAGAQWNQERSYSEEDMVNASKYGYNFHKTTQFPNQEFEDSCIRNTQQWLTTFKKK